MRPATLRATLTAAVALALPCLATARQAAPGGMTQVSVNGTELEYAVSGEGDPVLLIHGSILAEAFAPLASQPALAGYQLIRYHRRGFAGSAHPEEPVSVADQAADARALLDSLGIQKAHVIGHSFGALVALQLALDAPERVRSLVLMEPPLFSLVPSGPAFVARLDPVVAKYKAGDRKGAIDAFMQLEGGPDYRARLAPVVGRAGFEQAIADADTFFQVELPAMRQWTVTREQAARIQVPLLVMRGANTGAPFRQVHDLLREWYPGASEAVIPNATHALQLMNPDAVAEALASFFKQQR